MRNYNRTKFTDDELRNAGIPTRKQQRLLRSLKDGSDLVVTTILYGCFAVPLACIAYTWILAFLKLFGKEP